LAAGGAALPGPHATSGDFLTETAGDEQGLRAGADLAVEVGQDGCRQARAASGDDGPSVQADPLADRLALQMDGEFRVDEMPAADVERAGDAVPAVGAGEPPLQRAGLLVRQQRVPHPGPD